MPVPIDAVDSEQAAFPSPVTPPAEVQHARLRRTSGMLRVAAFGIGVRMIVIGLEFVTYWLLGH